MPKSNWHPQTLAIRTQLPITSEREHSAPVFLTSSYRFDSLEHGAALFANEVEGNVYSRYTNPNVREFIDKVCLLEAAEAGVATASGMAALFASFMALARPGGRIVANQCLFGATRTLIDKWLPRWGIQTTYVAPGSDSSAWEQALDQPGVYLCLLETPSSPLLDVIDIAMVAELCHQRAVTLLTDNAYATSMVQQPIKHGADLVMHTATKFIDGQGRSLGGVVVGEADLIEQIAAMVRSSGAALSAFNAWLLSKSLETLPVRMQSHCANAARLVDYLCSEPKVAQVYYPGLKHSTGNAIASEQMSSGGALVSFKLRCERRHEVAEFYNRLQLCTLSANLGDSRTIMTHPASTTHSAISASERAELGISESLLRVSVGLEHIDDIIADIDQAFNY